MLDDVRKFLKGLSELLDRHSWHKLLLASATAAVVMIFGWAWEQRATTFPALIGSPTALAAIGAAAFVSAVALVFHALFARLDRKTQQFETKAERVEEYLRADMQRALRAAEEARSEAREALAQAARAKAHNDACQRDLVAVRDENRRLRGRVERAERALSEAGLMPPPRSDWGAV